MATEQEKLVDEHLQRGCKFLKISAGSYYIYNPEADKIFEITSDAKLKIVRDEKR